MTVRLADLGAGAMAAAGAGRVWELSREADRLAAVRDLLVAGGGTPLAVGELDELVRRVTEEGQRILAEDPELLDRWIAAFARARADLELGSRVLVELYGPLYERAIRLAYRDLYRASPADVAWLQSEERRAVRDRAHAIEEGLSAAVASRTLSREPEWLRGVLQCIRFPTEGITRANLEAWRLATAIAAGILPSIGVVVLVAPVPSARMSVAHFLQRLLEVRRRPARVVSEADELAGRPRSPVDVDIWCGDAVTPAQRSALVSFARVAQVQTMAACFLSPPWLVIREARRGSVRREALREAGRSVRALTIGGLTGGEGFDHAFIAGSRDQE